MPEPLSAAHTITKLPTQDLERARGLTFERFEMPGFDARGDTIAAPDNYLSTGTGEVATFFSAARATSSGSPSRSAGLRPGTDMVRPDSAGSGSGLGRDL